MPWGDGVLVEVGAGLDVGAVLTVDAIAEVGAGLDVGQVLVVHD